MSKGSIRSLMPTVAAIFDEVRKQCPEVRLMHGAENGHEIGSKEHEPNVFDIPSNYLKTSEPKGKK